MHSAAVNHNTFFKYLLGQTLDTLHTGLADRAVINPSALKTVPATGKFDTATTQGVFTGFNQPYSTSKTEWVGRSRGELRPTSTATIWYAPGINNWDMFPSKKTALTERMNFQFRFEVYNGFNRVQFAKPDNNTADA